MACVIDLAGVGRCSATLLQVRSRPINVDVIRRKFTRLHVARREGTVKLGRLFSLPGWAQDNYEIQVYDYETVDPGKTMLELHSNFTIDGSKTVVDGVLPTNHAQHETFEITHGVTDWFEVGFYIFTSIRNGYGVQWVGDHIRPRVRIPQNGNGLWG
jgi:hypothetical protein